MSAIDAAIEAERSKKVERLLACVENKMSPDDFGLDYYEALILRGLQTASVVRRDFNGGYFECEVIVSKAFCKRFKIDFLWMFEISKAFNRVLNKRE